MGARRSSHEKNNGMLSFQDGSNGTGMKMTDEDIGMGKAPNAHSES